RLGRVVAGWVRLFGPTHPALLVCAGSTRRGALSSPSWSTGRQSRGAKQTGGLDPGGRGKAYPRVDFAPQDSGSGRGAASPARAPAGHAARERWPATGGAARTSPEAGGGTALCGNAQPPGAETGAAAKRLAARADRAAPGIASPEA